MSMTELSPPQLEQLFTSALGMHQSGRLDQAEALYAQVIAANPGHFDALNLLGVIALQTNRLEKAAELFGRAIAISDKVADVHNNIGEANRRLGRNDVAIKHFERAVELEPNFAAARQNLARMMIAGGRTEEAFSQFQRIVQSDPNNFLAKMGIADLLHNRGQINEAAEVYQDVANTAPAFLPAQLALASIKFAQGDFAGVITIAMRVLQKEQVPQARMLFVEALAETRHPANLPDLRRLTAQALREAWARPTQFAVATSRLAKANSVIANLLKAIKAGSKEIDPSNLLGPLGITALANDELLRLHLETAPIVDVDLEKALTVLRFLLLSEASQEGATSVEHVLFFSALARQCYVNGYVFATTPIEQDLLARCKTRLTSSIGNNGLPHPLVILAVACYEPLHRVANAERLLDTNLPAPIAAVVKQQIAQSLEERDLAASLPALTAIDDGVSQAVRQQYEEDPYPTWVIPAPAGTPIDVDERMRRTFPFGQFEPLGKSDLDILIAGCGTGQQSVEAAMGYPTSRILAIDLSLRSLGYAARKTRELGLTNVEYAHADILGLSQVGRTFDVIESSGVLHHMSDPLLGWSVLLSKLRPGGFMRIGLYSKSARKHVNIARDFIAKGGYQPTPDGIRQCRQTIIASKDTALQWMTNSSDFFTTSSCRDLLFHVQEHQFTIPQIKSFIDANGLKLVGFENLPAAVINGYRSDFPDDHHLDNLDNWQVFEQKHPQMFGGMYQFWLQKAK